MVTQEAGTEGETEKGGEGRLLTSPSSAAAFVDGGIQDACDDSCSICLEPFCHSDPATVTSCKHEYHVQCILEWAQRSKECPMCWQPLSLKEPSSQELLDAVEQEQACPRLDDGTQLHQASGLASYSDFEERIMQHLAHELARRRSFLNSGVSDTHMEQPAHEAQSPPSSIGNHNRWSSRIRSHGAERHQANLGPVHEGQQRSPSLEPMESLKSRFLVASAKCKETLTRTTRSFKERWRGRNNKATDFRARAQEVSADVVRQALKRIAPASDGNEDVPTTSTSVLKAPENRCNAISHLEGVAITEALRHPPSEAV